MAVSNLIPRLRSRNTPVVRSEGEHPMARFHEEMDRMFEEFWRGWRDFDLSRLYSGRSMGFPHVELSESDKEIKVEAELPGLEEKDIELLLKEGMLTIRGERKGESEDKSRRISERYYGRFERQIALPVAVQEDRVSAQFENGVLSVVLPKAEEAAQQIKRIPINVH